MSEESLIRNCAPTLAGIKTGNLFTAKYTSRQEVHEFVSYWNSVLGKHGLRILPMRYNKDRVLLYVYRPNQLRKDIKDELAYQILCEKGYPCSNPDKCVAHLLRRLREEKEFPHEIGLFLSYPAKDVKGFLELGPEKCICNGIWRVYADETNAQKTFHRFRHCSEVYHKMWKKGSSLEKLTVTV